MSEGSVALSIAVEPLRSLCESHWHYSNCWLCDLCVSRSLVGCAMAKINFQDVSESVDALQRAIVVVSARSDAVGMALLHRQSKTGTVMHRVMVAFLKEQKWRKKVDEMISNFPLKFLPSRMLSELRQGRGQNMNERPRHLVDEQAKKMRKRRRRRKEEERDKEKQTERKRQKKRDRVKKERKRKKRKRESKRGRWCCECGKGVHAYLPARLIFLSDWPYVSPETLWL